MFADFTRLSVIIYSVIVLPSLESKAQVIEIVCHKIPTSKGHSRVSLELNKDFDLVTRILLLSQIKHYDRVHISCIH